MAIALADTADHAAGAVAYIAEAGLIVAVPDPDPDPVGQADLSYVDPAPGAVAHDAPPSEDR